MAKHMYSQEEKSGLVSYVNKKLDMTIDDKDDSIFELIKPGVILCKLVNAIEPGTLNEKRITENPKNQFEMNQNHDLMLLGAKKIKCNVVNIGAADLTAGTKHLVLGIFWQIVRYGILKEVSDLAGSVLRLDPALPPEQILLMWMNHHLKAESVDRVVTNFGEDLADGVAITHVMHHVASSEGCDLSPLTIEDRLERAEIVLQNSEKIGCRKFVGTTDIVEGNSRLLLAFVAGIFSKYPDMGPSQEALEWKSKHVEITQRLESQTQEWSVKETNLKILLNTTLKEKETITDEVKDLINIQTKLNTELEEEISLKKIVETELASIQVSISEVTTIKEETTNKLELSIKENEELSLKLEESLQMEEKMRIENEKLQQELKEIEESNTSTDTDNDQLRLELQGALEKITQYQQDKATLEEETEKITKTKKKLEKEKKSLSDQLEQALNKLKLQEEMIAVLNETVNEVKGQLEDERNRVEKLTKENLDLDDEIARLKARIAELEAELEAARARIKELEKQLAMHLKILEGKKKEGWLWKLSPSGNKRLQKRWFVLKGVTLSYLKNDKVSSKPLGSIDVTKSRIYSLTNDESKKKSGSIYAFEITYLDRGYVIVAASDSDRKEWVEALSKAKVHSTVLENIVAENSPEGFDNDDDDDD